MYFTRYVFKIILFRMHCSRHIVTQQTVLFKLKTENIYYVSSSFIWATENKQTSKIKTYVEIIDEETNPKDLSLFVRNKTGKPQKYHM